MNSMIYVYIYIIQMYCTYILSYCNVSNDIISYWIELYHNAVHLISYMISYHIILYHILLYQTILYHNVQFVQAYSVYIKKKKKHICHIHRKITL